MKILSSYDKIIHTVSDIEPDTWYHKGCFCQFMFHRGRVMQEALLHDPAAPAGDPHPKFSNRVVYLGQQILDYLAGYSDDMIPASKEIEFQRREDRKEMERRIAAENEELKKQYDAAVAGYGSTREAVLAIVRHHLRQSEVDITKAASLSCGVYFLREQGEIVYVGQSVSVYSRVAQHRRDGKFFDSVTFMPCMQKDLNSMEGFFIRLLRPKLNGHSRLGVHGAPTSQLWNEIVDLDARALAT